MDLGFDPVRIVVAAPETVNFDELLKKPVTIATEYQNLSRLWVEGKKLDDFCDMQKLNAILANWKYKEV